MSRKTTTRSEIIDDRAFSSPIARAFVRIVTECRGISEAQARQISPARGVARQNQHGKARLGRHRLPPTDRQPMKSSWKRTSAAVS